jgi:hypothetical protein
VAEKVVDGLGRELRAQASKDGAECATGTPANCLVTKTMLDGLDRAVEKHNPANGVVPGACGAGAPCVKTAYDGLGRMKQMTAQDGTVTQTTYGFLADDLKSAQGVLAATTVDAASVKKRVETDAFGRIAAVREYNGTQVLVTSYSYL